MDTAYTMTINGRVVTGSESMNVINPANGAIFATAPDCTRQELDAAVDAARRAFPAWKATPIGKRKELILAFAGAISQHANELARLLTKEQGKPVDDAMYDVLAGAAWLSEWTKHDLPEHISEDTDERKAVTRFEPIGVVAALVPWNFPIVLAMFKVAPALLAGNTMVLKPSPTTPLTTLKIGELARSIFPAGVLNVISGGDRLGPWMTSHPGFDKISFTGSTQTGKKVAESAARDLKRVTLELGGNDAAIVMADVDVASVARELFWAAFKNAGQICIASKRMYIHEDVYEPIKQAMADYAREVRVGDGSEQGTQIGPIQNKAQFERVVGLLEDSKSNGHKFVVGGNVPSAKGYFIPVTIIDNPPEHARIVQEEQFGPVLPLMKFSDTNEVVERANATNYGLGASIWTKNLELAEDLAGRLQAGTIWINESQYLSPHAPFGGHKQSGIGTEGGPEGLLEFTVAKTVFLRKPAASKATP